MNSLYGKFGMKVESTRVDMYDCSTEEGKNQFNDLLELCGETITDYIQIDETFVLIRDSLVNLKFDEGEDYYHGLNVNIAIASAITAYARIYMSKFKNSPYFTLYYSDTDSIVIDRELPSKLIGNKLGQLKLEHKIDKGIFLAPKVYALECEDEEEVIKVKGLTDELQSQLSVNDLERLLIKDSYKEFTHEKWFKKIIEGEIKVSEVIYTLKATSNKREAIYDNDFILSDTRPLYYDEISP